MQLHILGSETERLDILEQGHALAGNASAWPTWHMGTVCFLRMVHGTEWKQTLEDDCYDAGEQEKQDCCCHARTICRVKRPFHIHLRENQDAELLQSVARYRAAHEK